MSPTRKTQNRKLHAYAETREARQRTPNARGKDKIKSAFLSTQPSPLSCSEERKQVQISPSIKKRNLDPRRHFCSSSIVNLDVKIRKTHAKPGPEPELSNRARVARTECKNLKPKTSMLNRYSIPRTPLRYAPMCPMSDIRNKP
jgi:hypothetical protein